MGRWTVGCFSPMTATGEPPLMCVRSLWSIARAANYGRQHALNHHSLTFFLSSGNNASLSASWTDVGPAMGDIMFCGVESEIFQETMGDWFAVESQGPSQCYDRSGMVPSPRSVAVAMKTLLQRESRRAGCFQREEKEWPKDVKGATPENRQTCVISCRGDDQ